MSNGLGGHVMLMKDKKIICRTWAPYPPFSLNSRTWNIIDYVRKSRIDTLSKLPRFFMAPAFQNANEQRECGAFLGFLDKYDKVATVTSDSCDFYILGPDRGSDFLQIVVAYCVRGHCPRGDEVSRGLVKTSIPIDDFNGQKQQFRFQSKNVSSGMPSSFSNKPVLTSSNGAEDHSENSDAYKKMASATANEDKNHSPDEFNIEGYEYIACESGNETNKPMCTDIKNAADISRKNYVPTDPSYLKTLGHSHSGWIFGAIAELVDNSRDAKATKLSIEIEMIFSKQSDKEIPMLSIIDDGHGMTHQEILRMISFGHKQADGDNADRIGRFGIGFKSGSMRLGRDVLVLTQTSTSRSIAFLSQSLNEGKDNVEIPIISYSRKGKFMEVDSSVMSENLTKHNLKAIKDFSPFNKYLIGEKSGLFSEKGTGTQIYIWNLDQWGSDYSLEWHNGVVGGSTFHRGDVIIHSRRVRSRPGQVSQKVPLDFSLRSYLEVIFLKPRMKIEVQKSQVKSRPLSKCLSETVVENGFVMGKSVNLILGRCQLEWDQGNCGIFLYWHGRLIEAYKRVGGMVHNIDIGRGVIGVIDVTDLMNDDNGCVWVHSNKQGFQDCEPYAQLEEWLSNRMNEYLDKNMDALSVQQKIKAEYKPDRDWVQCSKCRKWRALTPDFDSRKLPKEWFCYMDPFVGKCEIPEENVEDGVITVSENKPGYEIVAQESPQQHDTIEEGGGGGDEVKKDEDFVVATRPLKRLKRVSANGQKKWR